MATNQVEQIKRQALENFSTAILQGADLGKKSSRLENLRSAMNSIIYGPTILRYMDLAAKPGNEMSTVTVESELKATAIDFLARSAIRSQKKYDEKHPGISDKEELQQAIAIHQDNVNKGDIKLVPEEFATTSGEGEAQVTFTNDELSQFDPRIPIYLAGLNYAAFTSKTMLTGKALLGSDAEGQIRSLSQWSEKTVQDSMPHLVISNLGMGEIINKITSETLEEGISQTIIDNGSGSGATLAGSILGLTKDPQRDISNTTIVGADSTIPMYNQLVDDFSKPAQERLGTGFNIKKSTNPEKEVLDPGELLLVNGDIQSTINALQLSEQQRNGITVITANYSWHRIPSPIKDQIIKTVLEKSKNIIFLVADLVKNESVVNRGYFNLRDNGLLNCGNIGLDSLFRKNGVEVMELNEKTAPSSMDKALANKIGQGTTSDSFFYVAYSGEKAKNIVTNWNK